VTAFLFEFSSLAHEMIHSSYLDAINSGQGFQGEFRVIYGQDKKSEGHWAFRNSSAKGYFKKC